MKNFNSKKLRLLQDIGRLTKVIDDEVDWFIASFREKDQKRRILAHTFFFEKQKERAQLAREVYEQFK